MFVLGFRVRRGWAEGFVDWRSIRGRWTRGVGRRLV